MNASFESVTAPVASSVSALPGSTALPLPIDQTQHDELDRVFAKASDLFAVLAAPSRLKIMHFLCDGEKTVNAVTEFLASSTQANISQHLAVMHRSSILGRRREGTSTFYWIVSEQAVAVCRSVCTQIAIEMED